MMYILSHLLIVHIYCYRSPLPEIETRETQYTPPAFITLHQLYDENTRVRLLTVQSQEIQATPDPRLVCHRLGGFFID